MIQVKFKELWVLDEDEYGEDEKFELKPWMKTGLFLLAWAVALVCIAVIYIAKSRYIYFWDDATYWYSSRSIANGSLSGHFWKSVYESIGNMDYNCVAALLSALFAKIFGGSRLAFVTGIFVLYLVPSVVMIYALAKKLGSKPYLTVSLIMLLCPAITGLALLGFVDIGGMLICLVCYYLYFTADGQKQSIIKSIAIGALLVLMMLWRRYYAFFAVSFITAMIADVILFKKKWYCAAAAILTAGLIITFFFRDFLVNILLADYGTAYSGYKYDLATDFKIITRYFGIALLLFLAVGSVLLNVKKQEMRPIILWLQIIACAAMFMATQTHGQQHLFLYMPSVIVLLILIIKNINDKWIITGVCALAAINTLNVCIPRVQPQNIKEISHYAIIPDFSALPRIRDDAYDILELKNKLDTIIGEGEKLGVFASSLTFNEDILKNSAPSLNAGETRTDYILPLPMVDSRDTDLSDIYGVNYMLVAYPAQTHLAEGMQTIITEGVNSFTHMTDFAAAFEAVSECEMRIGGMDVKLYRRARDVTQAEKREFESRLYK